MHGRCLIRRFWFLRLSAGHHRPWCYVSFAGFLLVLCLEGYESVDVGSEGRLVRLRFLQLADLLPLIGVEGEETDGTGRGRREGGGGYR